MKTLKIPFQIDSRGGVATVSTTREIVAQQITDLLVTNKFERLMNPLYGADVRGFLFNRIDQMSLSLKAGEIQTLLQTRVKLANVIQVVMSPVVGSSSSVVVAVSYTITPSPEVHTVQQTVSGLVTEETFA